MRSSTSSSKARPMSTGRSALTWTRAPSSAERGDWRNCVKRGTARRREHECVAKTPCTIAQELRGVTNVVRGSADLARVKLEPDHPAAPDIARIIRACEEFAALAMELRAMACTNGNAPSD